MFPLNDFSDHQIQGIYESVGKEIAHRDTADCLAEADRKRKDKNWEELARVACIYLRLAQDERSHGPFSPQKGFHWAGHIFRTLDQLERAAQCYYNSAELILNKESDLIDAPLKLAQRSAGRAKGLFEELGEDEKADNAHVAQMDIKYSRLRIRRRPLLLIFWIWKNATGYGTRVSSWIRLLGGTLVVFSVLYWLMLDQEWIELAQGMHFSGVLTPAYLSVINLIAFGAYTHITPVNAVAQIVLIIQMFASFVIVGTGLTFLTRR